MMYEALKITKKKHKTTRNKRSSGYILQVIIRNTFKTSNAMG